MQGDEVVELDDRVVGQHDVEAPGVAGTEPSTRPTTGSSLRRRCVAVDGSLRSSPPSLPTRAGDRLPDGAGGEAGWPSRWRRCVSSAPMGCRFWGARGSRWGMPAKRGSSAGDAVGRRRSPRLSPATGESRAGRCPPTGSTWRSGWRAGGSRSTGRRRGGTADVRSPAASSGIRRWCSGASSGAVVRLDVPNDRQVAAPDEVQRPVDRPSGTRPRTVPRPTGPRRDASGSGDPRAGRRDAGCRSGGPPMPAAGDVGQRRPVSPDPPDGEAHGHGCRRTPGGSRRQPRTRRRRDAGDAPWLARAWIVAATGRSRPGGRRRRTPPGRAAGGRPGWQRTRRPPTRAAWPSPASSGYEVAAGRRPVPSPPTKTLHPPRPITVEGTSEGCDRNCGPFTPWPIRRLPAVRGEPVRGVIPESWFSSLPGIERAHALRQGLIARPPLARLMGLSVTQVSPGAATMMLRSSPWLDLGAAMDTMILGEVALSTAVLTGAPAGTDVRTASLSVTLFRPPHVRRQPDRPCPYAHQRATVHLRRGRDRG